MLRAKRYSALAAILGMALIGACAPTQKDIRVNIDTDALPAPAVRGVVTVVTTQAPRTRTFSPDNIQLDYRQLADETVSMLQSTIDRRQRSGGEAKSLEILVASVDCPGFVCWYSITIIAGDGTVRGLTTEGSGYSRARALQAAMEAVPAAVFAEASIREYVAR